MAQAQGKRRAQPQGTRQASAERTTRPSTSQYQGRRAAEKTRTFALPLLRFPSVGFPKLHKPVVAASVAVASLVGVGAVTASGISATETVTAEQVERGPLGTAEITVAASPADEAVMSAAEVLNQAAVLSTDNAAIERAAAELEALLADIENQASTSAPASERTSTASRSYSREALGDAALASSETDSGSAADNTDSSANADAADDSADAAATESDSDSQLKESSDQGLSGSAQAASDLPAELSVDSDSTYVAKHALEAQEVVADPEVQVISETTPTTVAVTDNSAELPIGDVTVVVELTDSHIAEVKEATERLQALRTSSSAITVRSASEVAEDALESAWARAISAEAKIGDYSNGQIPLSALTELASVPGHYARDDAAIMFAELNKAFKAEFGRNIKMTDSYRSYASQVATKANKGWLAAPPGTSNHGWGLALDIAGPESQWNSKQRNWMVKNAATYGWISPDWAQSEKPEPWHWEYAGPSVSSVGRQVLDD